MTLPEVKQSANRRALSTAAYAKGSGSNEYFSQTAAAPQTQMNFNPAPSQVPQSASANHRRSFHVRVLKRNNEDLTHAQEMKRLQNEEQER